jgi:hypothetical protein
MASLKRTRKPKKLSKCEIDDLVVAKSENLSAWTKPLQVKRALPESLMIPQEVALRAAFFSRLHRSKNLHEWLTRIIEERLDMEEAAYQELKRDFAKAR